jgi:hypothetical protein
MAVYQIPMKAERDVFICHNVLSKNENTPTQKRNRGVFQLDDLAYAR